jgi:hypothetical protein
MDHHCDVIRFVSLQMPDHPLITQADAQRRTCGKKAEIAAAEIADPELFVLSAY